MSQKSLSKVLRPKSPLQTILPYIQSNQKLPELTPTDLLEVKKTDFRMTSDNQTSNRIKDPLRKTLSINEGVKPKQIRAKAEIAQ